jgi:two-component system heavy metal sensor histidine kinase CusS
MSSKSDLRRTGRSASGTAGSLPADPIADRPLPVPRRLFVPRTRSITRRLAFLYSLSGLAIFLLAAFFFNRVIEKNLAREDIQFLADKINVLRQILHERPAELDFLRAEVQWEAAARRFTKYYARIMDDREETVIETSGMGRLVPPSIFPPPLQPDEAAVEAKEWRSSEGQLYLVVSAWAEVGDAARGRRLIQIALDESHEEALMADYFRKMAVLLFFVLLLSTLASIAITRKGMHPLEEITRAAQRITANQLHERIDPARWPRELIPLAVAFDEMLSRLEDSFTRLSQFSADLAHELRTPINSMMGEAEVALSRVRTPSDYRQVLESSLEEYGKLSRMVDSLLFLARAESTELRIERSRIDARKEIEAVREFYDAVAEEQGVTVKSQGEGTVRAEPVLFRRAISNLLSNALKFTPPGGTVTLSVRGNDQSVEVRVKDSGTGIPAEHLPRIFDRFYRADPARSQHLEGTGLGLAIVKSIMELHQGAVRLESRPGQGTTAILTFPP